MLQDINSEQLKRLDPSQRTALCEEIRKTIIDTVHSNGGHLSSNLGVVELTVALCTVFDFQKDKIVWDVGHQCYPYKLLTGRYKNFSSLRQRGGISGFPKREESAFDAYNTGHAGNSVSAAIGIAKARDLKKEDYSVIAVIGDGSFNNGLIYEALNSLPILHTNVLIILNDNDMSISPTVGKTHEILSATDKRSENVRLIEQYGVKFSGTYNGNNVEEMIEALQNAKSLLKSGSVLVHVKTKKGMGYGFCEDNPVITHGVSPHNAVKQMEYSTIFGQKMLDLAEKREDVVVITAAMTDALGLRPFFEKFPERSMDVGICEENASVLCAAMASNGLKPYYAIYSTFLQRAFDEIVHDVCAQDLPVVFCIDRGGVSGSDGETHQGVFDLSYLSLIPNMTVAVPKDGEELRAMLDFSLSYPHPLAIRYPRSALLNFGNKREITVGSFEYLTEKTDGKLTVLACGERALTMAMCARKETGIAFDIVNARFVKPLDLPLLSEIRSANIITIEDNTVMGGLGDQINRFYMNSGKTIRNFALRDVFIPQGTVGELQREFGLNFDDLVEYIQKI